MCYEGKPMTRHLMIEKAKPFYDKMSITDKCTFSDGRSKKLPIRT
jgi:hypothetical protein